MQCGVLDGCLEKTKGHQEKPGIYEESVALNE